MNDETNGVETETENLDLDRAAVPEYITIRGERFETLLTELDLTERQLTNSDIEPLKYMVHLTELNLGFNQISDVSPLAELTNLNTIHLRDNYISDTEY